MRGQDGYGPLYADKAEHANGSQVKTTAEKQLELLQETFGSLSADEAWMMGWNNLRARARHALDKAGLAGWTEEQALHLLGISQEPQQLSTMMPSAGEYNI